VELGEYLTRYLVENNLSYRDFARKSQISHAYIAYICNGKTQRGVMPAISMDKLKQIAKGMGIDLNQLLNSIDVNVSWGSSAASEDEEELLSIFRTLNPYGQKAALSMLQGLANNGTYAK
jgi:transcriptional regulator with XRE-family HTH domain